ncbi:MAG: YceI family protein [Actinomycetota bacterium]|nr:YceI family protein [Actinomycetota bacterium]
MAETSTKAQTRVSLPAPGTYEIDPAHTGLSFISKHMMLAKVRGRFGVFSGTIHIDEQPERSWVEVEIDASTIDTNMPMRDDHLRSGDFLDLENHPTMVHKSTGLEITGERTFKLHGDLTIRGTTLPVDLDVEYEGVNVGLRKETRVGFTATGEIDREAYGMMWNQALETGGVLVGKTVKIELDIQAVRKDDAA